MQSRNTLLATGAVVVGLALGYAAGTGQLQPSVAADKPDAAAPVAGWSWVMTALALRGMSANSI